MFEKKIIAIIHFKCIPLFYLIIVAKIFHLNFWLDFYLLSSFIFFLHWAVSYHIPRLWQFHSTYLGTGLLWTVPRSSNTQSHLKYTHVYLYINHANILTNTNVCNYNKTTSQDGQRNLSNIRGFVRFPQKINNNFSQRNQTHFEKEIDLTK